MAALTLLLQARARFGGQRVPASLAPWLGRADRVDDATPAGARLFDILPRGWPVAAVTRQQDAGDAAGAQWLRADPAYIRPDINGARLLAYGPALELDAAEAASLLRELKPLFGDTGMPIDAPVPARWYVRLGEGATLPVFAPPGDALGADLFEQLPAGPDARRWRALLSEAQVMLHNHPVNQQRIAQGRAPVNSLWFWGAGRLPDHVRSPYTHVRSDDDAARAFATFAGVASEPVPARFEHVAPGERVVVDLREQRDGQVLAGEWLQPAVEALQSRALAALTLAFDDGRELRLARSQRWRVWRRPVTAFASA